MDNVLKIWVEKNNLHFKKKRQGKDVIFRKLEETVLQHMYMKVESQTYSRSQN